RRAALRALHDDRGDKRDRGRFQAADLERTLVLELLPKRFSAPVEERRIERDRAEIEHPRRFLAGYFRSDDLCILFKDERTVLDSCSQIIVRHGYWFR